MPTTRATTACRKQEKLQASREAIEQSYAARTRSHRTASGSSPRTRWRQRQRIDNQIAQLERNEQRELAQLTREALDEQTQAITRFGDTVAGAFNCQLRGLLSGTESWRDAVRKTLGAPGDRFHGGERSHRRAMDRRRGRQDSGDHSGRGVANERLEQAGAAASLASQGAAMIRSILGSAAEAFAGVFGFLAPIMGPFAAGPAAAAQATVASAAGAVASADIGMWSVPADMLTLVHHNELIMPASRGRRISRPASAARRAAASGRRARSPSRRPRISTSTRSMPAPCRNGCAPTRGEMLRAIDEAVRHGAHLGLRRVASV